jgi:hypothetical protein
MRLVDDLGAGIDTARTRVSGDPVVRQRVRGGGS